MTSQLAPFVGADDPRLTVDGPEVDLTSVAAEALGLALHELATNSVKYGALRDAEGRLTIAWEVVPDEAGERRFRMVWTERAAAPITPPVRRGFGRLVIERVVQSSLNGKVTLDFPPEGMVWRIDAPDTCPGPGRAGAGGVRTAGSPSAAPRLSHPDRVADCADAVHDAVETGGEGTMSGQPAHPPPTGSRFATKVDIRCSVIPDRGGYT